MRVRYWGIILFVLVIVGAAAWWWRNSSSAPEKENLAGLKPKLAVASMDVTDIDADRIKLTSRIVLSNPLPLELKTNRLDYSVYIDSIKVMESAYDKPIRINSSDSATINMPLEILAKPMLAVLKHFETTKADSADYMIKARFQVDVPVAGNRYFDMDIKKRLPAVRLPKMKPGPVDVDKLGLNSTSLDMVLHVENPNIFPLKMKDGRYVVTIDKNMKMEGAMEKIINIPARGSQDVTVHLDMKTANMGKLAWKLLFDKKDTPFHVDFRCKLLTDNDILRNSNMAFTANGTLEELKKLAKK